MVSTLYLESTHRHAHICVWVLIDISPVWLAYQYIYVYTVYYNIYHSMYCLAVKPTPIKRQR